MQNNCIIENIKWGEIVVNGKKFKDIKIWNNIVKEWNWNETNTKHNPGIQIKDVTEFIDDVDIIILSKGYKNMLETKIDTINFINHKNKKLIILTTDKAVKEYNRLAELGYKIGGLIHSTC